MSGPVFAWPSEVEHEPSRMFLKRELFGVDQPDVTVPLAHVEKKCCVLTLRDFCSSKGVFLVFFVGGNYEKNRFEEN